MIFSIILIKNTNNLLLELGPLAVKAFYYDVARDLLKSFITMEQTKEKSSVLGTKTSEVYALVMHFCKDLDNENLMNLDS